MCTSHSLDPGLWESFYEVRNMKKKVLLALSYIVVAMLATVITLATAPSYMLRSDKLSQLEALIEEKFIDEADKTAMEDAAAAAMVKATGDRWSYYIPADEYDAYKERMANAYVGVGITIQAVEEGGFLIVDVTSGGPAEEAGLQVEDIIVGVEGQDVTGYTTTEVRDVVKGKEGTFVSMTVLRQGREVTLSVERRQVQTPVAAGQMLPGNVGLVTIENFDSRCAEETIAIIESLLSEGAEKLIFDVRHNPGGYASELVKVLDHLLPEGELFRALRYDGNENIDYSDASCLEIPMAVLVNADSYSAAEFFAAAMAEYEAAIVVGEQTTGKGNFQQTYQLSDGSAVALSVGKYFTPKGVSLADAGGVIPDIRIELDAEAAALLYYGMLDPMEDAQIQAALEALK